MNFRVVVEADAKLDSLDAVAYYDGEQPGLGGEYLDDIEAILARIEENPLQFPIVDADFRRAMSRRFPYFVYFRVTGVVARVRAILHQHRGPDAYKASLQRKG